MVAWDPFKDMKKLGKEMDKAFQTLSKTIEKSFNQANKSYHRTLNTKEPKAEISQDAKKVTIVVELPDMNKRDIHLKITEDHLEVFAEKHKKIKIKKKRITRQEESYRGYKRVIPLPPNVILDKAVAVFKNHKLTVKISKSKKKVSKKVTVD